MLRRPTGTLTEARLTAEELVEGGDEVVGALDVGQAAVGDEGEGAFRQAGDRFLRLGGGKHAIPRPRRRGSAS